MCTLCLRAHDRQEVKLWKDTKDRRKYEDLSDLYAIIKVLHRLTRSHCLALFTTLAAM